jgi:cytochrome c-type biogenesis protein CcmH/NrfF
VGECTCGYAAEMRAEIANLVKMGMTHDQVIQYYINKYGSQEPLAEPIDKGFNRLAWLFPYVLGATGALVIGLTAFKWSRRPRSGGQAGPADAGPRGDGLPREQATDPTLEARLDDELRDLD